MLRALGSEVSAAKSEGGPLHRRTARELSFLPRGHRMEQMLARETALLKRKTAQPGGFRG